jgi:hypothetical protein
MSDIANELRERSLRAEQEGEPLALLDEAADEIERLRLSAKSDCPVPENAADEDKVFPAQNMTTLTDAECEAIEKVRKWAGEISGATPAFIDDVCVAWARKHLPHRMSDEHKPQPNLTDEEREAVEVAAAAYADDHGERFAATLRKLLERTK